MALVVVCGVCVVYLGLQSHCPLVWCHMLIMSGIADGLNGSLIVKHLLATVVTALGAYSVIHMPCAAVAATGDSGSHSHVVSSSRGCASL